MPGDVHFNTAEGDSLNLQSVLSQYVFAALAGKPSYGVLARSSAIRPPTFCGCTISWNNHRPAAAEKGRAGRLTK